jgi:hypothetical protein
MIQFAGKDSKRHFTVVMGGKEHGLYVSSTPSSAARKAVTKLCAANKSKKVEFEIREITQGSKKKTYGSYKGYIEKLKEPIELKGRVIRYKPIAKLCGKSSSKKDRIMKGGKHEFIFDLQYLRYVNREEDLLENYSEFKEKIEELEEIKKDKDSIFYIEDESSPPSDRVYEYWRIYFKDFSIAKMSKNYESELIKLKELIKYFHNQSKSQKFVSECKYSFNLYKSVENNSGENNSGENNSGENNSGENNSGENNSGENKLKRFRKNLTELIKE